MDLYIRDMIIANKDVTGATAAADRAVIIMDANPNMESRFLASASATITT